MTTLEDARKALDAFLNADRADDATIKSLGIVRRS